MKTLDVLNSQLQARMLADYLKANGVEAFVNGSREYASIITGSDFGRYEIHIVDEEYEAAIAIYEQLKKRQKLELTEESGLAPSEDESQNKPPATPSSLKLAVLFAVMNLVNIPVLFGVISFFYLWKYVKTEKESALNKALWATSLALVNLSTNYLMIYKWVN